MTRGFKYLIEKGADVDSKNKRNQTPLMIAALKSHVGIVKYLVVHGAQTDVEDENGRNIIQMAGHRATYLSNYIGDREKEVIKYLTKSGVNINARDKDGQLLFI